MEYISILSNFTTASYGFPAKTRLSCWSFSADWGDSFVNKKLSYRRETARQLPTWRGATPSAHSPYSGYTYAYGRIRNPQQTYVKRAVHQAHFKMNRAFKVIQGDPYWCQQESTTVCCRNVQFMPTLFLKLTKTWQRENGNSSISTTPLKLGDVPARNAFEYLQMINIARN